MESKVADKIKGEVREAYGQIARRFVDPAARTSCCGPTPVQDACCCGTGQAAQEDETCCAEGAAQASACCGTASTSSRDESCCAAPSAAEEGGCCSSARVEAKAARLGYSLQELGDLPDSVTEASLGCGNPTAIASLRPGEVVLDLGSGGGIDCFLAARRVGPTGRVIGLDMTTDMIRLARRNAKKVGATNVDFRYGEMEEMPIPDSSVDVIISNCVINLSPDKDAVFAEAFRVLKPGGRLIVSDIVTDGPLPDVLRDNVNWAGCVTGALDEGVYLDKMRAAGLTGVAVTQKRITQMQGFLASEDVRATLERMDPPLSLEWLREQLDQKIASVIVEAHKPAL